MKNTLRNSKKNYSEGALDEWLSAVDLGKLAKKIKFTRVSFPNIKATDWDKLYSELQKSTPINIRLPNHIIHRIKIASIYQGIPYQTLIKQWISEKLNSASEREGRRT